jgi:carbon storage regulator CsrA
MDFFAAKRLLAHSGTLHLAKLMADQTCHGLGRYFWCQREFNTTSFQETDTMLVLSRHANEEITIGKDITVKILHLKGGRVRIGIEAPKDVNIRRGELAPLPRPFQLAMRPR